MKRVDESDTLPQGDVRLIDSPVARHLLATQQVARVAYLGKDGTPRLITVNALWNGAELVFGAFAGTYKIRDLTARPDVAITIDTTDGPPKALMLRGKVTLREVDGVLPEYATLQLSGMGAEAGGAYLKTIDQPGLRMVRVALRPAWVGVLDFENRFPIKTPKPVLTALGG